jgi:hypothetical protein
VPTSHAGNNQAAFIIPTPPAHFSIEGFWFPLDLPTNGNTLFELGVSAAKIGIAILASQHPQFYFSGFGGSPSVTSFSAITFNAWHHLAATFDGTTMSIYVNGSLAATTTTAADPSDPYGVYLAQNAGGVGAASAAADVALYQRTITPTEVGAHYAAADQLTNYPVFRGGAAYPNPVGGSGNIGDDLSSVLAAVRRTVTTVGQP